MSTYKYTATTSTGEMYQGELAAADRFAVYHEVRQHGGTVVSVREVRDFAAFGFLKNINARFSTVKAADKIQLMRNLSAMLGAGLPLSRALSVLERQARSPKLRQTIQAVEAEIQQGSSFSEAAGKHPGIFSNLAVAMIKAGEESGSLTESLKVIAEQLERSYQLTKKVRGALIYPSIVVAAMVGIGVLMLIYVVPTLTTTFTELGVELPTSTKVVIVVSTFLVENTILFFALLIAAVIGFIAAIRTRRGKRVWHFFVLRIPLIGKIVKEVNSARTARTLSSLLSSGVSVIQSLSIAEEVLQNVYFKAVLKEAAEKVQKGDQMSSVFLRYTRLYTVIFAEMVAVGEETGKLAELFGDIATFYEGEVEQQTKDLSTVIEPFLMLFIGAVVGFFAISMISPIYSLGGGL